MTYNYIARNKLNERISGAIEASDQCDAMRRLENMGLTPVSLECSDSQSKLISSDKLKAAKPTSDFERLVFGITRFVALLGAGAVLIGIVGLVFALLSPKQNDKKVTYEEVVKQQASSSRKASTWDSDDTYSPIIAIPKTLQEYIKGDNVAVVNGWLRGMTESQQRDFLKNMTEVVSKANARNADIANVINSYKTIKLQRIQKSEMEQYTRMAVRAGYISGIFGLLLILCILGLVLVMLAIERNTRPEFT